MLQNHLLGPFGTPLATQFPFTETQKSPMKVVVRWLIPSDMTEVLEIEQGSFEYPWWEEDFICCLWEQCCIGMVAEYEKYIVGFMIYELHKTKLHILNFAVDPAFRRYDVGTQMAEKLVDKLSQQRRTEITVEVRETNLAAQLFFKRMGFRGVLVLHNHYDDTDEDGYLMRFSITDDHSSDCLPFRAPYAPPLTANPWAPANRISEYDTA